MIVKGRCRGNGAQLGAYLLNSKDNDRAEFLAMFGTASSDPRRALLEMSLSSELTGRTKNGLYHTQLSPRESEAATMTHEQKLRAVDIMVENLEIQGHKWALVEHEKEGRKHLHLVFERYDHESRTMWDDDKNYAKHTAAARQMEREFGWQFTHDKTNSLDKNIKGHITDMWIESGNGAEFVQSMHKAGFEVTQGMDKRPYQIVDQYGNVHDLTRQLQGFKQADVSNYLNGIRSDLRPTAEASQDRRREQERQPEQSDVLRELSDSQDQSETTKEPLKSYSYSFKAEQPPTLPHQPDEKTQSDNSRDISDSQDLYIAMLEHQRRQEADRQTTLQQAQEQGRQQTQSEPPRHFDPITGAEISEERHRIMQEFQERQRQREQERKDRNRDTGLSIS